MDNFSGSALRTAAFALHAAGRIGGLRSGLVQGLCARNVLRPAAVPAPAPIENRGEIIAAVSAALAEEMGTDISAIRILSFKKI